MATKSAMELDAVDDADEVVGRVLRKNALSTGANFRTAHVFVFDRHGRILLQKLADAKERHAGRWGSSVATFLHAGEDYLDGAKRGLRDELGIHGPAPTLVAKVPMRDGHSTKFVGLFELAWDGPILPEPEQVATVESHKVDAVAARINANPDEFTPTFTHLLQVYMTHAGRPHGRP